MPIKDDGVRVLSVRAKNILRITEATIDDMGDIHVIAGDTDQGKTSLLHTFRFALSGLDKTHIRNGADGAEIELRCTKGTIQRILNRDAKRDTVIVTDTNGEAIEAPEDFVRALYAPVIFSPTDFMQLAGGEGDGRTKRIRNQRNMILAALPERLTADDVVDAVLQLSVAHAEALHECTLDDIEFNQNAAAVCDALEDMCISARYVKNRDLDNAELKAKQNPAPDFEAPAESVDVLKNAATKAEAEYNQAVGASTGRANLAERRKKLADEIAKAKKVLPNPETVAKKITRHTETIKTIEGQIADLNKRLEQLNTELATQREGLAEQETAQSSIETYSAKVADLAELDKTLSADNVVDLSAAKKQVEQAQFALKAKQQQIAHDAAIEELTQARAAAGVFDDLVKLFRDTIPKRLIEAADLGIVGLDVVDGTLKLNGVPLYHLGTSKQIRYGVQIVAGLSKSNFVCVDRAESLGTADRLELAEVVREKGYQLLMTVVNPEAEPGPGVTVMRDGKSVNATPKKTKGKG